MWILEDSCHSPGGYFIDSKNKHQECGNGKFADLSIFSFHPVKHIACGEGGMITTNNKKLYEKLRILRTHGITKSKKNFKNQLNVANGLNQKESITYPKWYMEMQTLGYNYRITEIQAALGISQLKRAKAGVIKRKKIYKYYYNFFKGKAYIINQSGLVKVMHITFIH